jgi:hypothetical protein
METTASNPAMSGIATRKTLAVRIAATLLMIAAAVGLSGIAAAWAVSADDPAPAVQVGARPMQFR